MFGLYFEMWDSFVQAGATINELEKLDAGEYDRRFVAKVMAWRRGRAYSEAHQADAQAKEMKRKNR